MGFLPQASPDWNKPHGYFANVGRNGVNNATTLASVACLERRSIAVALWSVVIGRQRWGTAEILEVNVAAVGGLRNIIGGTSKRLLPPKLAAKLLLAIVIIFDMWVQDERLSTTSLPLPIDGDYTEEQEPTGRNFVAAQALLGLEFLFDVLDASLCAVVLVIDAMVIEDVLREVFRPLLGVSRYFGWRACGAIQQENVDDLPLFVQGEGVFETALGVTGSRIGELRNVAKASEKGSLPVCWEGRLKGTSQREVAESCGTEKRGSAMGGC